MKLKRLSFLVAALVYGALALAQAAAPSATLTWGAPTLYSDGTAIPAGVVITYNVYQGTSATALTKVASGVTALTDSITTGLVDGTTYYFAVTAVAGGLEGAQSNVASKTFAAVAPGTVTLTVK
jgi:hypothetical protein